MQSPIEECLLFLLPVELKDSPDQLIVQVAVRDTALDTYDGRQPVAPTRATRNRGSGPQHISKLLWLRASDG